MTRENITTKTDLTLRGEMHWKTGNTEIDTVNAAPAIAKIVICGIAESGFVMLNCL